MPVCSTGISVANTGVPASVVIDAAYVQSLLPAGLAWLYPYLPWMHGLQIGDVGAFCSVDPPTWSVPSGADIYAFISGGPLSQAMAVDQFIQDITRAYLWYNLCHCASVTTPAPPSAPAAPSGLPAVNPGGIVTLPITPCASYSGSVFTDSTGVNLIVHQPIPSDAINVNITVTGGPDGVSSGSPDRIFFTVFIRNSGGTLLTTIFEGMSANAHGSSHTTQYSVPGGAAFVDVAVHWGPSGNTGTISGSVDFLCTDIPSPSSGVPACCTATDVQTRATLQQILDMITLLQRQIVPFAYISGAVHSGLSGTGTISVQGIIGVLLNVSIPSRAGEIIGTPDTRFDVGWINFGTADGYASRQFIDSDSQLVFPDVAGTWTLVAYTLLPGVSMTITELVREA